MRPTRWSTGESAGCYHQVDPDWVATLGEPACGAAPNPATVSRVKSVEFVVAGDPTAARDIAAEILGADGFTVTWVDAWSANAVRGKLAANVLLGGFAQQFKVGLSVSSLAQGQSVIRFERQNLGLMGGWIGVMRTNKNMKTLKEQFGQAVTARGIFVDVREA